MSSDTYIYPLGSSTYVNLTNRCTNNCSFCVRHDGEGVGGFHLWLQHEPTGADIIAALSADKPRSVVFCGFGEPTLNLSALLYAATFVKAYGGITRTNTNGHANLYHGRDITGELAEVMDAVSISLNAADAESYAKITNCRYGQDGFSGMLDFAQKCTHHGIDVTLSVVDVISEPEIERCRKLADSLGVSFRVRPYVL